MSTVMTPAAAEHTQGQRQNTRPSFFGIVRGEFFKILHQRLNWIMLILLGGIITLPYLIELSVPRIKAGLTGPASGQLSFFYNGMEANLSILRVFIGIFLLIMTARVIGLEYQLGTIRILLGRGVGRLQLLLAKLLTIVLVALALFVLAIAYNLLLSTLLVSIVTGSLSAFNALTPQFWSDSGLYALTVLISMGVTILLATAVTALGRSLTVGLSVALAWFPVDNIGTLFMALAYRLTQNDFWLSITSYFLGPNLNTMASVVLPQRNGSPALTIGTGPLVFTVGNQVHGIVVNSTHTLLVALVYAVIFAVVAVVLTWRRDVME